MDLCVGIYVRALHEVLWIMRDSQKKAALFCVLALLFGLLVATSGCANRQHVIGIQLPIEAVYTVLQPPVVTMGEVEKVYQSK